jgi:hypothetical protein
MRIMLIAARPTPVAGAKIVSRKPDVADRGAKLSPAELSKRRAGRLLGQVPRGAQLGLLKRGLGTDCCIVLSIDYMNRALPP